MRNKIQLDTYKDVVKFVAITGALNGNITVTDNEQHRVNAKSLLGMLYSLEFNELWVESDNDYYNELQPFILDDKEL